MIYKIVREDDMRRRESKFVRCDRVKGRPSTDAFPAQPAAFSSRALILGLLLGDLGFACLLRGPLLQCTEPFYCWTRFPGVIVWKFEVSSRKRVCLDFLCMWKPWLDR